MMPSYPPNRLKAVVGPLASAKPPVVEDRTPFWWIRWVPTIIVTVAALWLFYSVGKVALIPLLVSFAAAYVLNPLVEAIEQTKLSRLFSALIALLLVGLLFGLFAGFVIPDLWQQSMLAGSKIFKNFNAENSIKARHWLAERSPLMDGLVGQRLQDVIRKPSILFGSSNSWFAGVATGFVSTAAASMDLLVVPFFVFYILVDFAQWRTLMEDLIPPRFRLTMSRLFDEIGRILQAYVLGQLLIALLMGLLYALGFAFLRVPAWAGIATLAGLLNVVPYVGTLSGLVLASGFTYAESGELWRVAGILGWFVVVQCIEGYILTPRILGGRLSLHPMAVFLGLLIGGKLFGLLGILLAVPVIAVSQVFFRLGRELYKESDFYHAGDIAPEMAASPVLEERLAKAADTVLSEQIAEGTGDELMAPAKADDDPVAKEAPKRIKAI